MSDELREVPPDAHLLAALRHAPDREAVPPPGVSALILAQAQQAVGPVPGLAWTRRLRQALQALDRWLPGPALGGAVAALALATVIGVMWRGGPPEDRSEPNLAEATAPVVVAAAPVPAPTQMPQESAADHLRKDAPPPPAPITAVTRAAPPAPSAGRSQPRPPAGYAPPARAVTQASADARKALAAKPLVAAAPAPPRTPELARLVESAQAAASAAPAPVPEPLAAVLAAVRDQPATVQVLPGERASQRADRDLRLAQAQAPAAADAVRERFAGDERLARKAPASVSDTAAGPEWLAQVARAAQGRWQAVAAPALAAGEPGHVVQVGGVEAGRLVLTGSGVLWLPVGEAAGSAWQADLDAPVLQALRAQAPRR